MNAMEKGQAFSLRKIRGERLNGGGGGGGRPLGQ